MATSSRGLGRRKPAPRSRRLAAEPLEPRTLLTHVPQVVAHIGPYAYSYSYVAYVDQIVEVNGVAYFRANDGTHGMELWRSDGTAAGTAMVADLFPGFSSSYPRDLTNVSGTLFFSARDGTHGYQLWKSDGTANGTVMVKDNAFAGQSYSRPSWLTNVSGTLFFSANDGVSGNELWKSDGTAAGTVLVKDIRPGPTNTGPWYMCNVNGTLFFGANDGTTGIALWKSNGTASGTVLVKDIHRTNPGLADLYQLTNFNGTLFFVGRDDVYDSKIWTSDGTTAGTAPFVSGPFSYPNQLTNIGGTLYFDAQRPGAFQFWKSDGTPAGTTLIADSIGIGRLTNVNGAVFFVGSDSTHGAELWKTDGTAAGTAFFYDTEPSDTRNYFPTGLANINGSLFFSTNDYRNGIRLWATIYVDQPPVGSDRTVTTLEDTAYTFSAADFGFTDPGDSPPNALAAVKIGKLPLAGVLADNGSPVIAGQYVPVADIAGGRLQFTPFPNQNGTAYARFGFQVQDNGGTANAGVDLDPSPKTITINVTAANDAPVASDDNFNTSLGATLTIAAPGVLANDFEVDGDALTATIIAAPAAAQGAVTLNSDGSFTFVPATGYSGSASFTYRVSDGTLASFATVTISQAANRAPRAADDSFTTAEDTLLVADGGGVLANDNEPDGNSLSASLVSGPAHGQLTLYASGSFQYLPNSNYNGPDSFVYRASDGQLSSTATVGLMVAALNDPPTAADDTYNGLHNTRLTIPAPGVLTNDRDVDGDPLTASLAYGPFHGSVTLAADGSLVYQAASDFIGIDRFAYRVTDGTLSRLGVVTINVPPNAPPTANADTFSTSEDTPLVVATPGVLSNDADADSPTLTALAYNLPTHGTLIFSTSGGFTYTPAANYNGPDSFTYRANDGQLASNDLATVSITVTPVNDAPVGVNDRYDVQKDTPLTVTGRGVLANDTDVDNDPLTATPVDQPAHGTLSLNADGSFMFTPTAGYTGPDHFTYHVSDGSLSSVGTVTLNIAPPDLIAAADTFSTAEDTLLTVAAPGVIANDHISGASASAVLDSGPLHGILTLSADGSFTYFPAANYKGLDSFTYRASDGAALSLTPATVAISVTPVNDAPSGADTYYYAIQNAGLVFQRGYIPFSDTADTPPNQLLAIKFTTVPSVGSFYRAGVPVVAGQIVSAADIAAGLLWYNSGLLPNFNTIFVPFTYQVQDDGGTANGGVDFDPVPRTATIDVESRGPNFDYADVPYGISRTISRLEDQAGAYTFSQGDFTSSYHGVKTVKITGLSGPGSVTDDGVPLTVGQVIPVADIDGGKVRIAAPPLNFAGSPFAEVSFQVQDGGGTLYNRVDIAPTGNVFTLNITSVNDPPSGADSSVATIQETPYTIRLGDFGFADPNDSPANNLLAVKVVTLPAAGSLTDGGVLVTAGQFVSAADVAAGKLVFSPVPNQTGSPYGSVSFQVKDDGGTANSGGDLDPSPNTLTFNVIAGDPPPIGLNNTISTREDVAYAFASADFFLPGSDPGHPAHNLLAVKVLSLPAAGTVTDNGAAVAAGQVIPASDITTQRLQFASPTNANGSPYASFAFQVQDDGGTAGGRLDVDPTPNTITLNVLSVNDAPRGADTTLVVQVDASRTLQASDFGFTDPDDSPPNRLYAVVITSLPSSGRLTFIGAPLTLVPTAVSATQLAAGTLAFTPALGQTGNPYANFSFRVQDDGGTANLGVDTSVVSSTIALAVVSGINHAPSGADRTFTHQKNEVHTFAIGDFGFSDLGDTPPNNLRSVKIVSLPQAGSLTDGGVVVTAGQFISVADIAAGSLRFTPIAGTSGSPYASLTFQVQDDGGTAAGGGDLDPTAHAITVNYLLVNSPPSGLNKTITIYEDNYYYLPPLDFGFADPGDMPAHNLLAVKITALPTAGTLTLGYNNVVLAGQLISFSDLNNVGLRYLPATNAKGSPYASFTFQVMDDGGTVNGGSDLDPSPNTITFNVLPVNDPPQSADSYLTLNEDYSYIFTATDFPFSDLYDDPPNSLRAIRIVTLPSSGMLYENGSPVTYGQVIPASALAGGQLYYYPPANANNLSLYAAFAFQVQDDGGTAFGGVDLDLTPNTVYFSVRSVNDAPYGTDKTIMTREDVAYIFSTVDWGFYDYSDSPANSLAAVKITTLPTAGTLTDNDAPVSAGQFIPVADLTAGRLKFIPDANANGVPYASFTFQVKDDGGTANGGVDLDYIPNTITISVLPVNDPPVGVSMAGLLLPGSSYKFSAFSFSLTDPNDTPPNYLQAVKIVALPTLGNLTLNGSSVTAGQFIPIASINTGQLIYAYPVSMFGDDSFTFQIQDDGGTANFGTDLDPIVRSFSFFPLEPPPDIGKDGVVEMDEDASFAFAPSDFAYVNDNTVSPVLLGSLEVISLPAHGLLTDNNLPVALGQIVSGADVSAGLLAYSPPADANGVALAIFTFRAGDANNQIDRGVYTLTVNVAAVNDPPSFVNGADQNATDESGSQEVAAWATQLAAGPPDEAAQNLTFRVTVDRGDLFASLPTIDATGKLTFTAAPNVSGTALVSVVLKDDGGTANGGVDASATQTFAVNITKPHPQHNAAEPMDVDSDRVVAPADALQVIDYLNALRFTQTSSANGPPYYDVNGDGFVSPIDALLIIDQLNAEGMPEGESPSIAKAPPVITHWPTATPPTPLHDVIDLIAADLAQTNEQARRQATRVAG